MFQRHWNLILNRLIWVPSKYEKDFNDNVDNYIIRNENYQMYQQKVNN